MKPRSHIFLNIRNMTSKHLNLFQFHLHEIFDHFFQSTVTFQFILATDGAQTFSYTLYKDVNILYPPGGRQVAIGYAGIGSSQSSIFSFTESGFQIGQFRGNTFDSKSLLALLGKVTCVDKLSQLQFTSEISVFIYLLLDNHVIVKYIGWSRFLSLECL